MIKACGHTRHTAAAVAALALAVRYVTTFYCNMVLARARREAHASPRSCPARLSQCCVCYRTGVLRVMYKVL